MNRADDLSKPADLSQLQRWFQSVITHGEGIEAGMHSAEAQKVLAVPPADLEKVITRSRAMTAVERLAIYANAFHTRLLECLGEVFPLLKRTLGEDGFNSLAFGYLQVYPSRTYTLNELGRQFPLYLEQTRPADNDLEPETIDANCAGQSTPLPQHWPEFLIDLARLEWAIYEVFDGAGVEGVPLLATDQVLAIPPECWPEAKLTPVSCLRLLATHFPVNDYYTALRRAQPDHAIAIPAAKDSFVALTRRDFIVRRYNLTQSEFELLRGLKAGQPVGEALQGMLAITDLDLESLPDTLSLWFRNWTMEGFFQSVSVGSAAA